MSLIPMLFDDTWPYRVQASPSRLLDQAFGLCLEPEDLFQPLTVNNRLLSRTPAGYLRNWRSSAAVADTGSTVHVDSKKFQADLDVQQFKPDELTVKVTDNNVLIIEGKHEEKKDQHGFISRHFVRRYVLPKHVDATKLQSKLSSDGVLSIIAPAIEAVENEQHKTIPITQTGEPAKQQKTQQNAAEPKK